jgi:hypothetical protein
MTWPKLRTEHYCTVTTTLAVCDSGGEVLVAVTVNAYLPGGVPPVFPLLPLLLPPPQLTPATRNTRTMRASPAPR